MVDVQIDADPDLATVARALKGVDRDLKREVTAGLRRAAAPTKAAIVSSARSTLPSRGGLAGIIAGARVTTKTKVVGNPTVTIDASLPGYALRALDEGRLRHPVFGRGRWVSQTVPSGFFSDPITNDAPRIRREIERTVEKAVHDQLRRLK